MFSGALRERGSATEIDLAVTPGAREEGFLGYDPWRKRLSLRVKERPVKGRANKAVLAFLAGFFKIPPGDVKIIRGRRDNMKTVQVNIGIARALERLRNELD